MRRDRFEVSQRVVRGVFQLRVGHTGLAPGSSNEDATSTGQTQRQRALIQNDRIPGYQDYAPLQRTLVWPLFVLIVASWGAPLVS